MPSIKIILIFCLINFIRTEIIINSDSINGDPQITNLFSLNETGNSDFLLAKIISSLNEGYSHDCQKDLNDTVFGYKLKRPWAIASEYN